MNSTKYCITSHKKTLLVVFVALVFIITALITYTVSMADTGATAWALCKPGAQVNIRRSASKKSEICGFLEVGDEFRTDMKTKNGFLHVIGMGEYGEGWVYLGFVSTEKPEPVFENYCVIAKNRVACRRWCDGPQVAGKLGWIYNGSDVTVFYTGDGWAVTSRGYIRSEFLEADPK